MAARRSRRRALDGAGGDVHLLLRPADRQAVAVGERHPGLPLPRRAGRRLVAARRRRRPHRPARRCAGPAGSARSAASRCRWWRWCTTWAGRAGSSTCCGSPSRPRRCRWAPGSCRLRPARRCGGRGRAGRYAAGALPAPLRLRLGCSRVGRPAGLVAALVAPAVATYTAVLLVRHRHARRGTRRTASCRSSSSGRRPPPRAASGMIGAPVHEAGPARRLAVGGALLELAAEHRMEQTHGHHRRAAAPGQGRRG